MNAYRTIILAGMGILLVLAVLGSTAFAQGSFSHVLSFQGRLCATDGKPLPDGPYIVQFAMYDAEVGGTGMWTEFQGVTQIGGVFVAYLGAATPFPASLFTGGDRWLGISVGADPEMSTRFRLTPSPWAIYAADSAHAALADQATNAAHANTADGATRAADADKVDNIHASATPTGKQLLALDSNAKWPLTTIPQGTGSTLDADTVDSFHAGSAAQANRLLTLDATAKWPLVTIPQGTGSNLDADKVDSFHAGSSPIANRLLTLDGGARWPITTIPQGPGSTLNADTVDNIHASATPTANYLLPLDGTGKLPTSVLPTPLWTASGGNIYRASGNVGIGIPTPGYTLHVVSAGTRAIYGETSLGSGYGVYGNNSGLSGNGVGVYGESVATDGNGVGVEGIGGWAGVIGRAHPTGSSSCIGVGGEVNGGAGTNTGVYGYTSSDGYNYGVYGYAYGGNFSCGVYGFAAGGTTNYAGYFDGDVYVIKNITKEYSGAPARATPIAYGVVDSAGNVAAAGSTSNFTCSWSAANQRYEITISGESYHWLYYVTNVTPMIEPRTVCTSSVSGKLLVTLYDSSGNKVQGYFQFVTYAP